jgi:hypothetical protein
MKANTLDPQRAILFDDEWIAGDDVDVRYSNWIPMAEFDVVCFQLLSGSTRAVASPIVVGTDEVDDAGNWSFVNGRLSPKDVGAVIEVAGSEDNNNSFNVTVVNEDGTFETDGTTVAEEFGEDVTVTVTRPARAGAWAVEVNNIWDPMHHSGEIPFNFPPSDITSEFSPSIAPVVPATAATHNQPVNAALFGYKAIRLSFTPEDDEDGVISAAACAKGSR